MKKHAWLKRHFSLLELTICVVLFSLVSVWITQSWHNEEPDPVTQNRFLHERDISSVGSANNSFNPLFVVFKSVYEAKKAMDEAHREVDEFTDLLNKASDPDIIYNLNLLLDDAREDYQKLKERYDKTINQSSQHKAIASYLNNS